MPTRSWSRSSGWLRWPLIVPALLGLPGCGSCGLDEEAQARCAVELGGPLPSLMAGNPPGLSDLGRVGPHPVWSTQPHLSCSANPRFSATSSDDVLELLITYPAATDPLESGFGDVAAGQWPVILFAHANSYSNCRSLDAYPSLHEQWASWGYVVASVDASPLCEKNSQANLEARRDDLIAAWGSLEECAISPPLPPPSPFPGCSVSHIYHTFIYRRALVDLPRRQITKN